MPLSTLLSPFTINNLTLRNRLVLAPMSYYKNPQGIPTQAFADFHQQRANNIGLSVTGATGIDRPAANNHPQLANINNASKAAWANVVQQVHATQSPIALQLWHAGGLFNVDPNWQPGALETPSGLNAPGDKVGEPMTEAQIADCIDAFARAAALAVELGFDMLELHAAHGFLIDQFFWAATNLRNDRWGGRTLADRSAFGLEVVRAIRAATGKNIPLSLRVSQWKEQDYGVKMATNPSELEQWLTPFKDAGIDIFHCSQRRFWEPEFSDSDLNFAGWVKKVTGSPTITVGSVGLSNDVMSFFHGEPAQHQPLDELLRRLDRGDFDLVAVGRALLTDPQWAAKISQSSAPLTGEISVADLNII